MGQISWTRGYGVASVFVIQSDTAFEKTYGKHSFNTLWNECEMVLALPGQRSPQILGLIEKALGREAVIMESRSGNRNDKSGFWLSGHNLGEDGKPLKYADEIRQMDQGILIIRRNRPLLVDVPPYAAIHPIRGQVAINPFHGKPFLLPAKVWLTSGGLWTWTRLKLFLKRKWKRHQHRRKKEPSDLKTTYKRRARIFRTLSSLVNLWWLWVLIYLFAYTTIPMQFWHSLKGGL